MARDSEQHYYTGSDWLTGEKMQAPNAGQARVHTAPTTGGWRVDIGDPAYPIRYWDGSDTRFSVDDAGAIFISTGDSGYRVEIGDPTTPIRYWDGTTTRFSVDNAGNISGVGMDLRPPSSVDSALTFHKGAFSPPYMASMLTASNVELWALGESAWYMWSATPTLGDFPVIALSNAGGSTAQIAFGGGGSVNDVDVRLARDAADVLTLGNTGGGDSLELVERSAPGTPSANRIRIYAKDSGGTSRLFYKDDAGAEHGPL